MSAPGWAVEALIASALLMTLVLLARAPVRRAFGPTVAYALWALPVLRLLLPPLPDAWSRAAPISRLGERVTILMVDLPADAAATTPPSGVPSLGLALAILWATGAAVFLSWHLLRYRRFRRRVLASPVEVERRGGIRIVESAAATGPLAFGVLRRYVALPADCAERYDREERELAVAHELGHHARGDLLANWAALVVLALHWCNPVAWVAFRAFRADQELANDARVLAGRGASERHAYARAIVKSAGGGAVAVTCHLHTIADLKGRLTMLSTTRPSRFHMAAGTAATVALSVAGLGLTASGSPATAAVTASVGDTIGVDFPQGVVTSVAPASSVPPAPPITAAGGSGVATTTASDGGTTRTIVMRAGEDGAVKLNGIPEVDSRTCVDGRDGDAKQFVINHEVDGRRIMVICANRIEKAAAEGAAAGAEMAANSAGIERNALQAALSGLRATRQGLLAGRGMEDPGNREAIPAIEEAIAEVEADLAEVD